MSASEEPSPSLLEYFRALRTEIIEAQKLRVQVGLAKTVFLGTLFGFFFKDGKGYQSIMICPFVALMFDCMVYGLSFNIRDVGSYIGEHLEAQMALKEPWQRYRVARTASGFRDWGRIAFTAATERAHQLAATLQKLDDLSEELENGKLTPDQLARAQQQTQEILRSLPPEAREEYERIHAARQDGGQIAYRAADPAFEAGLDLHDHFVRADRPSQSPESKPESGQKAESRPAYREAPDF